jgi:hypothetical protein
MLKLNFTLILKPMLKGNNKLIEVFIGDEIIGMSGDISLLQYIVDPRFNSVNSNIQDLGDNGWIGRYLLRLILPLSLTRVMISRSSWSGVSYSLLSMVG